MRVISGRAKGHQIYLPQSCRIVRPITDRAKTALFDILNPCLVNNHFLDLYAGAGNVGIEALSRGAAKATFVEQSNQVIKYLRRNLTTTNLITDALIYRMDARHFLTRNKEVYDIIFLAPPQYRQLWIETLNVIEQNPQCLKPDTQIIVQIDPTEYTPFKTRCTQEVVIRRYGNVMFVFYKVSNAHYPNR